MGMCSVQYQACSDTNSFTLSSGTVADTAAASTKAAILDSKCTFDYVEIIGKTASWWPGPSSHWEEPTKRCLTSRCWIGPLVELREWESENWISIYRLVMVLDKIPILLAHILILRFRNVERELGHGRDVTYSRSLSWPLNNLKNLWACDVKLHGFIYYERDLRHC